MKSFRIICVLAALIIATLSSTSAFAQGDDWDQTGPVAAPESDLAAEPATDESLSTSTPAAEGQLAETAAPADRGLAEDPAKKYFLVGARLRWIFFPKFFLFGQVDMRSRDLPRPLVSNVGVGAEFTYRRGNFDITPAIWWVGLGWDGNIAFKGKGEGDNSWEVVQNTMSAVLFSVDFIWSTPIVDWFAITYGVGVGLGIPIGDIVRTEASASSGGYDPCIDPDDIGRDPWCGPGEEYNDKYQKFPVPWVNFLLGTRFKPHKNMAIYVDGGFGIGFQLGVRGGYIF